jgi:hypothetical protein
MINWLSNAVVAVISPYIIHSIGFYIYMIYGCAGCLMSVYAYLYVPETMGKSLEEMVPEVIILG